MDNAEVTCGKCGCVVGHRCGGAGAMDALLKLYTWHPATGNLDSILETLPGYDKEDENAPFLSEVVLYSLLGKGDARTFLHLVRSLLLSLGVDPDMSLCRRGGCRHLLSIRAKGSSASWCPDCGALQVDGEQGWSVPSQSQLSVVRKRRPVKR